MYFLIGGIILLIQYMLIIITLLDEKGRGVNFKKSIKTKKMFYTFLVPFSWIFIFLYYAYKHINIAIKELE